MNTIRKPRARPRVDSVNFRTFFWLLRVESAFMVYRTWYETASRDHFGRERVPMDRTAIFVARSLKLTRTYTRLRRLP